MPDGFIGENTRLIYDIMSYTENNNIDGLLLLIVFEKAFDSLSLEFLYRVLDFHNFGTNIIDWFKIFNNNIKTSIL